MNRYTHTTKGVRENRSTPVEVVTLISESGQMRLTITLEELDYYEKSYNVNFGDSISDDSFGAMLRDLLEDGILEREWINEEHPHLGRV